MFASWSFRISTHSLFSSIFIAHISDDSIPDMYWLIESSILLNVIMTALLLPTPQRGEIISEGAFNLFKNQHIFVLKAALPHCHVS